jgi:hypothetical protein
MDSSSIIELQWKGVWNKESTYPLEVLQTKMGNRANEVASKTEKAHALGS